MSIEFRKWIIYYTNIGHISVTRIKRYLFFSSAIKFNKLNRFLFKLIQLKLKTIATNGIADSCEWKCIQNMFTNTGIVYRYL